MDVSLPSPDASRAATKPLGWSLGLRAQSPAAVIDRVRSGFSVAAVERVQQHTGFAEREVAEIMGTSVRTLARRRKAGRLDAAESDRLYRIARLFERAVDVFGGDDLAADEARLWFRMPQWGLGDRTPLDYARTETGAHEVETLLGRIDAGVLV